MKNILCEKKLKHTHTLHITSNKTDGDIKAYVNAMFEGYPSTRLL